MITKENVTCVGEKPDMTRCTRRAQTPNGFCHRHDTSPEAVQRRKETARKAGSSPRRRNGSGRGVPLPPVDLATVEDAFILRENTINDLRAGLIDRHTARLQLQACRDHVEQFEATHLGERMERLEEVAREFGFTDRDFWKLADHLLELKDLSGPGRGR